MLISLINPRPENLISTTIKSKASIHYCGWINFDCRYSTSSGIEQLCLQLSQISQSIRSDGAKNESNESVKLCTALMGFIKNELSMIKGAISISELWKHYNSAASSEDDLNLAWYLYPPPLNNKMTFIQTCQKLNLSGNMLLIPHEHNIEESLLILDNDIQVHACLKEIQQDISNDLGMLEESKLKDILSDSLVDMKEPTQAIEYLKVSQFCTEITPDHLIIFYLCLIIKLRDNASPYAIYAPRNVPIPLRPKVQEELNRMKKIGVIRKVSQPTPWCAGMVVVPKKSGSIRICVDLKPLNECVLREVHPIPKVDDTLAQLACRGQNL